MIQGVPKKINHLISSLVVACVREDTKTRFKEAPFCAFGDRSWLSAYGTSMRLEGEIIGKVVEGIFGLPSAGYEEGARPGG